MVSNMVTRYIQAIQLLTVVCMLISTSSAFADPPEFTTAFKDRTTELGLTLRGTQACWVDVDNDGWVDLVASGVVWKNNRGKSFAKLAEISDCRVVAGDFDNDGFADLFSWSTLKLYHNNKGKSFSEVKLPELPATIPTCACWGDFDGDGFIDLYIGGYESADMSITYPSIILHNNGGKSFRILWTDATYRARGVTACDFNRDGRLDIYVSNYRLQPNLLWLNDGTGHFRDAALEFNVVATSPGFPGGHSIGACWGDFDNDGDIDLFASNFAHVDERGDQPKSRFLRNLGSKNGYHFQDMGTCGVFYQESYGTPAAGDYDNDGNLDLFLATVYDIASFGVSNYPVLFHNEGRFAFTDVTSVAGLAKLPPTCQAAWADFNHDGFLDLVTAGKLFINQGNSNHWLEVHLEGDGNAINRSAIGAQVRVTLKNGVLTRQVEAGTGEGNQNDLTLNFGLGQSGSPTRLEILWPNRKTQVVQHIRTDRLITVRYKP